MAIYVGRAARPEFVHWVPDHKDSGPGVMVEETAEGDRSEFIPWEELKPEIEKMLLPQVRVLPLGCTVQLGNLGDRVNWIMMVLDPEGNKRAHVWLGSDGDNSWKWDGMVRIGEPAADEGERVWQTFQRYSDGSYRQISAKIITKEDLEKSS